jgi:hypothetical protein
VQVLASPAVPSPIRFSDPQVLFRAMPRSRAPPPALLIKPPAVRNRLRDQQTSPSPPRSIVASASFQAVVPPFLAESPGLLVLARARIPTLTRQG